MHAYILFTGKYMWACFRFSWVFARFRHLYVCACVRQYRVHACMYLFHIHVYIFICAHAGPYRQCCSHHHTAPGRPLSIGRLRTQAGNLVRHTSIHTPTCSLTSIHPLLKCRHIRRKRIPKASCENRGKATCIICILQITILPEWTQKQTKKGKSTACFGYPVSGSGPGQTIENENKACILCMYVCMYVCVCV
jgi:hypothetical protein